MIVNRAASATASGHNGGAYSTQLPQRVDKLAIVAFLLTLVGWFPIAVILGHFAKRRIKATDERGTGLVAIALAIGYFWLIVAVGMFGALFSVPALEWLGVFD